MKKGREERLVSKLNVLLLEIQKRVCSTIGNDRLEDGSNMSISAFRRVQVNLPVVQESKMVIGNKEVPCNSFWKMVEN